MIEDNDGANVPVNIFLIDETDDGAKDGKWILRADNFMPRKCSAMDGAYRVTADTREELAALVAKYILPLYLTALRNVGGIVAGTHQDHYYWESTKE